MSTTPSRGRLHALGAQDQGRRFAALRPRPRCCAPLNDSISPELDAVDLHARLQCVRLRSADRGDRCALPRGGRAPDRGRLAVRGHRCRSSWTALGAAFIAMPGHKGLYGPQGTGRAAVRRTDAAAAPARAARAARRCEQAMPDFLPDRLEAGTHNMPGIAGAGGRTALRAGRTPELSSATSAR